MVETQPRPDPEAIGARLSHGLENVFSVYLVFVFAVLWLLIAAAAFTDGAVLADAWAWLSGLETLPAIIAWIAILPIAVWLWAWQADLQPLLMGLVMLGMVGWTALAVSGVLRTLRQRLA